MTIDDPPVVEIRESRKVALRRRALGRWSGSSLTTTKRFRPPLHARPRAGDGSNATRSLRFWPDHPRDFRRNDRGAGYAASDRARGSDTRKCQFADSIRGTKTSRIEAGGRRERGLRSGCPWPKASRGSPET